MGNYFLLSMRFNKRTPEDFGLVSSENSDIFIRQNDNSQWKSRPLYDYGWGKENGYFKIPMPNFAELVNIILESKSDDDKYGSAAVILDDYCEELLDKCFEIFESGDNLKNYSEFFKILQLQTPVNRSSTMGKEYSCVSEDYERWKMIANRISNI